MRIADFTTPVANLREAHAALELAWHALQESWDDPTSRQFDEQCIAPIKPRVKATLDAIHLLADVLGRAERECQADENG